MDTQPIPLIEDPIVLPTNPQKETQKNFLEGPSVSIEVEERALHETDQGENVGAHQGHLKPLRI